MNTLLKQKKKFKKLFFNKRWIPTKEKNTSEVAFEGIWSWIEKAIKEAREEGYKECFIKGWNLTKGELPNNKQKHKQGFIDGWKARLEAEKKEKEVDEIIEHNGKGED